MPEVISSQSKAAYLYRGLIWPREGEGAGATESKNTEGDMYCSESVRIVLSKPICRGNNLCLLPKSWNEVLFLNGLIEKASALQPKK